MPSSPPITTAAVVDTYECATRVQLSLAGVPATNSPDTLIADYGNAHEAAVAAAIDAVTPLARGARPDGLHADDMFQATLRTDAFNLRPDFLLTAQTATGLLASHGDATVVTGGDRMLVPADAKAARTAEPAAVLQVALYGLALAALGYPRPSTGLLLLATGDTDGFRAETVRLDRYYPLVASLAARYRQAAAAGPVAGIDSLYGPAAKACDKCRYADLCTQRRRAADDLCAVPALPALTRGRLAAAGLGTVASLAAAGDADRPANVGEGTFRRARAAAGLIVASRGAGLPSFTWLTAGCGAPGGPATMAAPAYIDEAVTVAGRTVGAVKAAGSHGRLPDPDPGDIFFDFEGFPLYPGGGLEYLFGWVTRDADGQPAFDHLWAEDRDGERAAFTAFIDMLVDRFAEHPGAHLYHYADYEVSALRRLAARHRTRTAEVEQLIVGGKFVDLFAVVRGALLAGVESYSIKKLEPLYGFSPRTGGVTTALGSVDGFHQYRTAPNPGAAAALRATIVEYNTDDCLSTAALADWLWARRGDAHAFLPPDAGEAETYQLSLRTLQRREAEADMRARLADHGSETATLVDPCVEFYTVEERAAYTATRLALEGVGEEVCRPTGARLLARGPKSNSRAAFLLGHTGPAPKSAGRLTIMSDGPLVGVERITAGQLGKQFDVQADDGDGHMIVLANPDALAAALAGRCVAVAPVVSPGAKQEALLAVCDDILAGRPGTVAEALLTRRPGCEPSRGRAAVADDVLATVAAMGEGSYVAVQGPPGAGKTFVGSAVLADAAARGWTVGVCSVSHRAVDNTLAATAERGVTVVKHSTSAKGDSPFDTVRVQDWLASGAAAVCGGTVFAFAALGAEAADGPVLDLLVVDEASQMSMPDALAATRCARRVVLLGDPAQLPHVAQAEHEGVAGMSVLAHLAGGQTVLPADQGFFLAESHRFGPGIASVVSELAYESKLVSAVEGETVGGLSGVFRVAVRTSDATRVNADEADACVALAGALVGQDYLGGQLGADQIVVVAPYNAMVAALRDRFAAAGLEGVRVGTVDAFQGQEAAVVLFCTTSSVPDSGRGVGFVLDVARLNVSLSRARALAVILGSPTLGYGTPLTLAGVGAAATAAFIEALPRLPDGFPG